MDGVTRLIQRLSQRFGLMRLLANVGAIVVLVLLAATGVLLSKVGRFLDGLLKRVMGFERPLVTLGRPWRRLEDDNVISVYLMNGPVDVSQLRANIQEWTEDSRRRAKWRRTSVMAGWFDVWRPPPTRSGAATFHIANHLIELAPMWRHRLVTEETADAYVAQVCRQPLAADQAPWQVLVLPLHEDPDGRTTCLVSKAHRRLSNELHVLLGRWTASCRPVETPSVAKEFPLESWNLAPWNPAGVEPVPDEPVPGEPWNQVSAVKPVEEQSIETAGPWWKMRVEPDLSQLFGGGGGVARRWAASCAVWWRRMRRWLKLLAPYADGPRLLLRRRLRFYRQRRRVAAAAAAPSASRLGLAWSRAVPRSFVDSVAEAADATVEQVVLAALAQAMADHCKQTGSAPESLAVDWTSGTRFEGVVTLPCCVQDGRLILQRLRDQDAQVRRHPSPVARLVDAMRRWPSLDVARRLVAAAPPSPVALATLRPPAHSGARALFRWPEPEHWTQLSLCLSLGVEDVRLGAACGALTPAQLSLIVNQIERHLNQLAAAYGVQRRRLSLYTPPQWTHGRFDPWLVRVSHQ